MAPLLLSHAIAYDCYCYCNPLGEHGAALSLMAASRRHQSGRPAFGDLPSCLPPSLPYVCLYMFTGLVGEKGLPKVLTIARLLYHQVGKRPLSDLRTMGLLAAKLRGP